MPCRVLCHLILLVGLTCPTILYAQSAPRLTSEIAPHAGGMSDLFIFTVTLEGARNKTTPQLETSSDFDTQFIGPRTSISIINGVVDSKQSFVYQLKPKREGTLNTPEVRVTIDSDSLVAPPIAVPISGGAAPSSSPTNPAKEKIFIHQSATPTQVYQGQQISNVLGLYSRVNIQQLNFEDEIADGFWQETISDDNRSRKMIQGVEFSAVELTRALFPLRSGTLRLPNRKALAKVPVERTPRAGSVFDPFDDDFFNSFFQPVELRDIPLQSNEVSVQVKPLPPPPRDVAPFSAHVTIVGPTSIRAEYSNLVRNVGESKSFSIVVTSEGNLNPLKTLSVTAPPSAKIYDSQPQTNHRVAEGRLVMEKTFTYSMVPTRPGAIRIPGVTIAYFDPESGTHKLATTSDIAFLVTGSPQESPATSAISDSLGSSTSNNDFTPIPTLAPVPVGPTLTYQEKSWFEEVRERVSFQLAVLVIALSACGFGGLAFLRLRRRRELPLKESAAQLSSIGDLASLEDYTRQWLSQRLPNATESCTFDELRALIRIHAPNEAVALPTLTLLDDLEFARYGGEKEGALSDLKGRVEKLITSWR